MEKLTIKITNDVGLHARPATYFIQLANSFDCSLWVEKSPQRINGKSLLGILSLGIHRGDEISIIANGTDEKEAIHVLRKYLEADLSDLDKIPDLISELTNTISEK